jgi:hypothetical protein
MKFQRTLRPKIPAALVNNGAINLDLFWDSNTEHIGVFAKIEPLLSEIREVFGARERMKAIRVQMAQKRQAKAA